MKFCSTCGSTVSRKIPADDTLHRFVCDDCDTIHYQNPRVITGCLPLYNNQILLCKRAIEPRKGLWTLPAGFMENGETAHHGAERETWEEAEAKVKNLELYTLFNLPHINQVYMFFRAEVINGLYGVGTESLETRLFSEEKITWDRLAFPTISRTLKLYFSDRKNNTYPVRMEDIGFQNRSIKSES